MITVKELIKKLEEFDGNLPVFKNTDDGLFEVVPTLESTSWTDKYWNLTHQEFRPVPDGQYVEL